MSLESMQDLLIEQLRDLHEAELRLALVLPRMARMAENTGLQAVIETHGQENEEHLARLVAIFEYFGTGASNGDSPAVAGLLEEIAEALRQEGPDEVFDAALVIELRRLAHFNIAGYTALIALAEALGEVTIIRLLQMTLDEVLATEERLSMLARTEVNPDGVMAGIPEEARRLGVGLDGTDFST